MKKSPSGRKNKLSLKRSAFFRLCIITSAAVVFFYGMGLSINIAGIRNVRASQQETLRLNVDFIADELGQDIDDLIFFMNELMNNRQLTRYVIAYDLLGDYQRMTYITGLYEQEYMIRRSSDLVESVEIMLPRINRSIVTDQAQYTSLDRELWNELMSASQRGTVCVTEARGRLWLMLPRYDKNEPMFLVAFSISPESLLKRVEQICDERTDGMVLTRSDGSVFAGNEEGLRLYKEGVAESSRSQFMTQTQLPVLGLSLHGYSRVNEQLRPFVEYRLMLITITILSIGMLSLYLSYYRVHIMRPINELLSTMSHSQSDGHYRIESEEGSEYDDIYARFNDMVEHIEKLAARVYEEQYRAQKAELKQLQMQIDPHFLYNSLYLIYRIARADGNASIASLSSNLSSYYRYITKMPEQVVLLQDEISHVMNYLEIQRLRFEPRVHIDVQALPDEIATERIPSLIIQPVVENAFQHGIKNRTDGGVVSMRYECESDVFRVIVADNSGTMTDERLCALWARLRDPDEDAEPSALRNLYRRLQLYENEQGLEMRCVDGGLTVILTFKRKGGDGYEKLADRG